MDRTVDIVKYLPPVLKEVDVFQQIAKAQNPEFNLLQERIVRTFSERFIQSATEYGIKRWESLLLIPSTDELTLQQRKERVLTYLNIKLPYTWRMLENMLNAYLGEGNFVLKYNVEQTKLSLTLNWLSSHARSDIESLFHKVFPVNIVLDIRYNQNIGDLKFDVPVYIGFKMTMNQTFFIK